MNDVMDRRLLCQCSAQPDSHGCDYRATAEDMRCDLCRKGCAGWAYLAAEETAVHMSPDSSSWFNWDDLDGDLP